MSKSGYELLDLVDGPTDHSTLTLSSCYEPWRSKGYRVRRILATINGIVLFQCSYWGDLGLGEGDLMLYNLFTRNYTLVPPASYGSAHCKRDHPYFNETYAYGFGYVSAAPDDDLKIARFIESHKRCPNSICGYGVCEIFSLKEFTWSKPRDMNIKHIVFETTVGTFLNGLLYWIPERMDKLIVVDVAKIVVFELDLPFQRSYYNLPRWSSCSHLSTIHGCLCLLNTSMNKINYNLWVMNDQADENSWSIRCSFTLPKDVGYFDHHFICMLDNGRIVMRVKKKLHIYDPSADKTYPLEDYVSISSEYDVTASIQGIEYVESLVSLSDACSTSHRSSS